MKITTFIRCSLAVLAISASLATFVSTQILATPPADAKLISVESLENQLPIGHLGVPLGTVVRVTGEGFDYTPRSKADDGKTLLKIVTVNGKTLEKPVVFEFLRAPASIKKPAPSEKFDYYVHEYGEFDGVVAPPKELGIKDAIVANDGFHYRRHLTIHASNGAPR